MRITGTMGPGGLIFDSSTGNLIGYRNPISGDDVAITHGQIGALASASGVVTVDVNQANHFTLTLTENVTAWSFGNFPTSGLAKRLSIRITQHAAAAKTVAWPSSFKWIGGAAGAVSVGLGAIDVLEIVTHDNGTTWNVLSLAKAFA